MITSLKAGGIGEKTKFEFKYIPSMDKITELGEVKAQPCVGFIAPITIFITTFISVVLYNKIPIWLSYLLYSTLIPAVVWLAYFYIASFLNLAFSLAFSGLQ